jgi:hypothetical protein
MLILPPAATSLLSGVECKRAKLRSERAQVFSLAVISAQGAWLLPFVCARVAVKELLSALVKTRQKDIDVCSKLNSQFGRVFDRPAPVLFCDARRARRVRASERDDEMMSRAKLK